MTNFLTILVRVSAAYKAHMGSGQRPQPDMTKLIDRSSTTSPANKLSGAVCAAAGLALVRKALTAEDFLAAQQESGGGGLPWAACRAVCRTAGGSWGSDHGSVDGGQQQHMNAVN